MVLKVPPPPPLAQKDQPLNRWLIELTAILNGQGQVVTTAITQPLGTNNNTIATTAFVLQNTASAPSTSVPLVDSGTGAVGASLNYARADHVHPTDATRAPLNSPNLTGVPTAPTPAANDNTAKIATTAFVQANVSPLAPSASPTFTGTPVAPTPAVNDNSTRIATTAFVTTALANTPLARNGSGAPAGALGSVNDWYADTTNKHIYVKTGAATWTLIL